MYEGAEDGFSISFGRDAWWLVVAMTILCVVCVVVGFMVVYMWQERKLKRQFTRNLQNSHMRARTASHNTEQSLQAGVVQHFEHEEYDGGADGFAA